jgi:hypothetical protein
LGLFGAVSRNPSLQKALIEGVLFGTAVSSTPDKILDNGAKLVEKWVEFQQMYAQSVTTATTTTATPGEKNSTEEIESVCMSPGDVDSNNT